MPSITLVLGGGGLVGYAYHVAALSALQRYTGWDPRSADLIVGTSAGSGVASIIRGDVPVDEALDRILTLPTDPSGLQRMREISGRSPVRPGSPSLLWPAAPGLALRELARGPFARPMRLVAALLPEGRSSTRAVGLRPRSLHPAHWPAAPLWLTAVRLTDGQRVVFGRDRTDIDVGTAVEASCAIPGLFRPVHIDGARHVDGGMHSATNADLLLDHPSDLAIVISPLSADPGAALRAGLAAPGRLFCHLQVAAEVRSLRESGQRVLLIEPDDDEAATMGVNPLATTRALGTVLDVSASMTRTLARREARNRDAFAVLRATAADQIRGR